MSHPGTERTPRMLVTSIDGGLRLNLPTGARPVSTGCAALRNPESNTVTQHLVTAVTETAASSAPVYAPAIMAGFLVFGVVLYYFLMREPDERVPTMTAVLHACASAMAGIAVTLALLYLRS